MRRCPLEWKCPCVLVQRNKAHKLSFIENRIIICLMADIENTEVRKAQFRNLWRESPVSEKNLQH